MKSVDELSKEHDPEKFGEHSNEDYLEMMMLAKHYEKKSEFYSSLYETNIKRLELANRERYEMIEALKYFLETKSRKDKVGMDSIYMQRDKMGFIKAKSILSDIELREKEEYDQAMKQIEKELEEKNRKEEMAWEHVMDYIVKHRGKEWYDDLMNNVLIDGGDFYSPELVDSPIGEVQDASGDIIKEEWVNQTVNGGYVGDDFAGDIYFQITENKYLKLCYRM